MDTLTKFLHDRKEATTPFSRAAPSSLFLTSSDSLAFAFVFSKNVYQGGFELSEKKGSHSLSYETIKISYVQVQYSTVVV